MILWTIAPIETLLTDNQKMLPQKVINYQGIPLLIESISPNQYKIVQILSTNPNDYMINSLQPGSCLSFEIRSS